MEYKTLTCRLHGGSFKVAKKAGRPPTNCSIANKCTKAKVNPAVAQAAAEERTVAPRKSREAAPVVVKNNPSVPLAYEAKRLLEPEGWKVTGRAWSEGNPTEGNSHFATVIGARGQEVLNLLWRNGKLVDQRYSMFSTDKPSMNGMPRSRLDFDPEELSNSALVRRLSGKKVTWWNKLGKTTESVTMPHTADKRVKVEHTLNGHGEDEIRIVTVVDQSGTGFRSFNVAALLKVV